MSRKPRRYRVRNAFGSALKFSKKIIIVMFLSSAVFTAIMIAVYLITGGVPDTLVSEFFNFFKLEGGALGIIKVAEKVISKVRLEKKDEE